ncbi:DUF305 domain-containing protein [Demequina soli]|uniref:DUF305 domain-containing protein n=1 Tax=Demequina soli TaxID=1638987 RepID=UPI00078113AE|nr:DUF305 domain-containing protein [Demequina soli]
MPRRRIRTGITVSATLMSLALAACSTDAGSTSAPSADTTTSTIPAHNDADTDFAQMMIVHHEGAIEMAQVVVETSESAQIVELGERILAAQQPEITTMERWLAQWDEDNPTEADHSMMDHGGMTMDGMDQASAMASLEDVPADEFDARFLDLMIAHHEGAIEMAESELENGENPEARALATAIIDAQQEEIAEMKALAADSAL